MFAGSNLLYLFKKYTATNYFSNLLLIVKVKCSVNLQSFSRYAIRFKTDIDLDLKIMILNNYNQTLPEKFLSLRHS